MSRYFKGSFPLVCLKCGHEFTQPLARVEAVSEFPCPKCGTVNKLDTQELRDRMRSLDKGLDKLRRQMRKFGKSR